jgi:hypothetical protein
MAAAFVLSLFYAASKPLVLYAFLLTILLSPMSEQLSEKLV